MTTDGGPRSALGRFFKEVLDRRVVPWLLAYLAGAWVVLEATAYLSEQFGWSPVIQTMLPVGLGFGILSVIALAWFHGKAGWQKIRPSELIIHGAIAVALGATLWTGSWGPEPGYTAMTPSVRRMAVLYFKDHTGGQLDRLTQDLTESVVHELAGVGPLEVQPLTAVAPFRDGGGLAEVVRELRVGTVVEGSVSRHGDSLRVIVQLVDAVPGDHFGSWEWMIPATGSEAAARALGRSVADSVRATLGDVIVSREREARASGEAVLRLYRRAREIYRQEAATDWAEDREGGLRLLDQADSLLAEAERLDPGWSAPPILRSHIAEDRSLLSGRFGDRSLDDLRDGIRHATRALEAGSDSAGALERRGKLYFALSEHSTPAAADSLMAAAERDLRAAIRRDQRRPEALMALSDVKERQGRFGSALSYAKQAVAADAFLDFGPDVLHSQAATMLQLEDLEGAAELTDLARRRFPGEPQHLINRLLILGSLPDPDSGDIRAAWATADSLVELGLEERRDHWTVYGDMFTACVLAQAGLADSANAVIRRARRQARSLGSADHPAFAYAEARARLVMGQRDSALALLGRYAERYPSRAPSLLSDWWFRELWDDPELQAITKMAPVEDGP
ncbi:MAG: hypothetical protein R3314_13605 [Longimicrobiales bacterium]|nr:hypothetical protein [Longimicrobiales bacterium]